MARKIILIRQMEVTKSIPTGHLDLDVALSPVHSEPYTTPFSTDTLPGIGLDDVGTTVELQLVVHEPGDKGTETENKTQPMPGVLADKIVAALDAYPGDDFDTTAVLLALIRGGVI